MSYNHLSNSYCSFLSNMSSYPKNVNEALTHFGWRVAIEEEMLVLRQKNN